MMSVLQGIVYGVFRSSSNYEAGGLNDDVRIAVFIDWMRATLWPDRICWTSIGFDLQAAIGADFCMTEWDRLGGLSSESNSICQRATLGDVIEFLKDICTVTAESMVRTALVKSGVLTAEIASQAWMNRTITIKPRAWSELRQTLRAELFLRNDSWQLPAEDWHALGGGHNPRSVTIGQISAVVDRIVEQSVTAGCSRE